VWIALRQILFPAKIRSVTLIGDQIESHHQTQPTHMAHNRAVRKLTALGAAALVYDQILSVPDSNFLEDLDLNEAAIEQEI